MLGPESARKKGNHRGTPRRDSVRDLPPRGDLFTVDLEGESPVAEKACRQRENAPSPVRVKSRENFFA